MINAPGNGFRQRGLGLVVGRWHRVVFNRVGWCKHSALGSSTYGPGERPAPPVLNKTTPLLQLQLYDFDWSTDTATRRWPIQRCERGFSLSRDRIRLNLTWSVEYWWLSTAIFACDYSVGKAVNSTILLRRRCVSNRLGISKFLNINVTPRFLTACVFVSDRTLGNYCGGGMLCWTCGRGSNR